MAQAEEQGWLTREAVMERLGVSKSTARQYLLELREAGRLVRVGTRYSPPGRWRTPMTIWTSSGPICREHGIGRRQDFIRLLGLEPEQGTLLLRRLTDRGELVLTGRHYTPAGAGEMTLRFARKHRNRSRSALAGLLRSNVA